MKIPKWMKEQRLEVISQNNFIRKINGVKVRTQISSKYVYAESDIEKLLEELK